MRGFHSRSTQSFRGWLPAASAAHPAGLAGSGNPPAALSRLAGALELSLSGHANGLNERRRRRPRDCLGHSSFHRPAEQTSRGLCCLGIEFCAFPQLSWPAGLFWGASGRSNVSSLVFPFTDSSVSPGFFYSTNSDLAIIKKISCLILRPFRTKIFYSMASKNCFPFAVDHSLKCYFGK